MDQGQFRDVDPLDSSKGKFRIYTDDELTRLQEAKRLIKSVYFDTWKEEHFKLKQNFIK